MIALSDLVNEYDGVVMVAKGALTYVEPLSRITQDIYVCWWSRFTYPREFKWITQPPARGGRYLLFDRNVTTGMTVYSVRKILDARYRIDVLATLDPLCRLGFQNVDYIAEQHGAELLVYSRAEFESGQHERLAGDYVISLYPDRDGSLERALKSLGLPIHRVRNKEPGEALSFSVHAEIARHIPEQGSYVLVFNSGWDIGEALLLTHIVRKPMIVVGDHPMADFAPDDAASMVRYLAPLVEVCR